MERNDERMKYILASHNEKKLVELQRILEPLGIEAALADLPEVEETGKTFAENARLKAESACLATGIPAVADDSGLVVDALGGRPGVYSARYAGDGATDEDRVQKLLEELRDVPKEKRTARFVSAICVAFPNGETVETQGECEGSIAFSPHGSDGFGYDPVFLVGDKTYSELSPSQKDTVSHRGIALCRLADELEKRGYSHADK